MNRVSSLIRLVMGAVLLLSFGVTRTLAQAAQPSTPPAASPQGQAQTPATPPAGKEAEKKDAEE
ncbi:MAG: hypothetical protein ABSG72_06595, partial [Candidatus Sulfotelmatobacter sp.]